MGQLLQFGQVIRDLNIQRADVAVGYTGYCVLLDQRVLAKSVIFMDRFGFIEVGADDVKRFHKMPMTYYLMLAARMSTDPQGRLYGDDITVEYLRMSRGQYLDFQRSVQANPTASAVMLTKEKRVDRNGKDVSGVKFMAAQLELSPAVRQKVELLKADPATIDSLFTQVDAAMGASVSAYDEWLKTQRQEGVVPVGQGGPVQNGVGMLPSQKGGGYGVGSPQPYGGMSAVQSYGGSSLPPQEGSQKFASSYSGGGSSVEVDGARVVPPKGSPIVPSEAGWDVSGFDHEFDGQGGF